MSGRALPRVTREQVVRLWLHRQGLATPRGSVTLDRASFTDHLERTGALQLDTINVVERAHYLTLWSRFGPFDRRKVDRWVYRDQAAYEYWGHEASILPMRHLPFSRRRMRRFPPESWTAKSWWKVFNTSAGSRRRVLKRLREEGPLESADFERRPGAPPGEGRFPLMKEDKRSLLLLWHDGRVAVRTRRHFRRVYDLAERVYPEGPAASTADFHDSWLLVGLSGNGVASEAHLRNYFTAPSLSAAERKRVIEQNVSKGRVLEVRVEGSRGRFYALPEHVEGIGRLPAPGGTTLLCPFDSLLWQRDRAEELLGFRYRIEIYVPPAKREFGYYVLPILHEGRLVGRMDPKMHRDRGVLEIKALATEPGFDGGARFRAGLGQALEDLRVFTGAEKIELPRGWRGLA